MNSLEQSELVFFEAPQIGQVRVVSTSALQRKDKPTPRARSLGEFHAVMERLLAESQTASSEAAVPGLSAP